MRVAVIFFGLARGLDITLPGIRRTLIAPAAAAGIRLELAASLNLVQRLDNPRTGEAGIILDPAEALLLGAQTTLLERQDDAAIAAPLAAAQGQPDLYANGWASVRNLLHQLTSLRRAWPLCEAMLARGCSHVLFLRPDLLYLDPIRLDVLAEGFEGSNSIALPAWHGWGGLNDRFAFADAEAARHYACRLDRVADFCARRPLHPESLLAEALAAGGCRVGALPVRAQRVRAGGSVVEEDFGASVVPLPPRPEPYRRQAGAAAPPPSPIIRRIEVNGLARATPLKGVHYLDYLRHLHRNRRVERYLEIGTQAGRSLTLARKRAVAIDPQFLLDKPSWTAGDRIALFEMTSDAFFAAQDPCQHLGGPVQLAFIDGMHLAECVLRDFINVERYCAPDGLIVLHDALPQNFEMTERLRRPEARRDRELAAAWTGDVWRVLPLLRRERPDLQVRVLDCPPTGLVLVSGLDPGSRVLAENAVTLAGELAAREATEAEFWAYLEALAVESSRDSMERPQSFAA